MRPRHKAAEYKSWDCVAEHPSMRGFNEAAA